MKIRDYEIYDEPLGVGGMGCVYKAHHISLGVYRAIKELKTDGYGGQGSSANVVKRFLHEARLQVQLKHQNIVEVFDYFEDNGKFYIVMELIEGVTLKVLIDNYYNVKLHKNIRPEFEGFVLDVDACNDIISQSLEALYYAHSHNTVHRDVKPANILLTKSSDGRLNVKLADFGIAKDFHSEEKSLTKTGFTMGTAYYMAPEQITPEDFGPIDHKIDIYAVGVMMFELLTGTYPFGDRTASEIKILNNKIDDVTPNLIKHQDSLPQGYYNCIEKAVRHNPAERFQDACEFKEALLELKQNAGKATVDASINDLVRQTCQDSKIIISNQVIIDVGSLSGNMSQVSTVDAIKKADADAPKKLEPPIRRKFKRKRKSVVLLVSILMLVILYNGSDTAHRIIDEVWDKTHRAMNEYLHIDKHWDRAHKAIHVLLNKKDSEEINDGGGIKDTQENPLKRPQDKKHDIKKHPSIPPPNADDKNKAAPENTGGELKTEDKVPETTTRQ
ncbi:Serine/threonine protein kinase domain protein [Candidatus Magnetobacterium bavaricum]|uniref:non-specific serine/threonine protein kinase n=1 Tax=Candidatus Magnetobacterium bavaricum TaxID=29290 RepID=A0A0F3GNS3_9BACT|nr:Serine/threonine protein kinase domain protein [Candidatus Magnetobacterium bavaricum]